MAMIPNEVIERIKKSANIVDIVSSYIPLEKKGNNYFGVCPFHDDHTPSMSVNEDMQFFNCFTCHKKGSVFDFVADYENVQFVDAVKIIADKVGIELDSSYKSTSIYDKHYEAMDLAVKYYQLNLNSKEGHDAREYLEKRGITEEIINDFQIGLAPKNLDNLTKLLTGKDFSTDILLETGLSNQGTTLYDLFRNRITFPIHNPQGKPVGFSARIYDNSDEAKYINTRETKIFRKGEILFNYHRAQNEARRVKSLIVVEGQMDAIRVYASGIKNVVATMGTAMTKNHIALLKKLNVRIILCMDNDNAGEQATITNGELLQSAGVETYVLRLSNQKDPDEYILKNGVEAYQDAVNNAISFFDFKLNYLKKNKNLNKAEDQAAYINSILKELNKQTDSILIETTINQLSEQYNINKNELMNRVIKVENTTPTNKSIVIEKRKLNQNQKLCETLLFYMMNDEKYIKLYEQELSYIPNEKYMEISNDILAFFIKYNYINIADFITYEIESNNYEIVLDIIESNAEQKLIDADYVGIINKIKKITGEEKIAQLKERLKSVSDINEKVKIMNEIAELKMRMCK